MPTELQQIADLLKEINNKVDSLPTSIKLSAKQVFASNLAQISNDAGLLTAGEFRVGNGKDPGSGYTGVRISYPPMSYGSDVYPFVSVNTDVLQVGISLTDGKLYAGQGAVVLSSDGIYILQGTGLSSQIKFWTSGGELSAYISSSNPAGNNILTIGSYYTTGVNYSSIRIVQDNLDGMDSDIEFEDGIITITAADYFLLNSPDIRIDGTDIRIYNSFSIGNSGAGVDYSITFDGENNNGILTWMEDENYFTTNQVIRATSSLYRRYYHIALESANPGASGATWVEASANTTGGWRLANAAHLLRGQADVHADWDGATDITFDVHFMCNVNNTGGGAGDTVDLKATVYYKGVGDTATKTQTVEVPVTIGASAQYKQFDTSFTINWDETNNVVEVEDIMAIILNLETDTSEVDDIVVTGMEMWYNTTHMQVEAGDV